MPVVWLILWIGLAVLTVALLLLTQTSWGQSRPLRKCAVLSLLAHVLLACLAMTVRIVTGGAGAVEEPAMYVVIDPASEHADEPVDRSSALKPWEEVADSPDIPAERFTGDRLESPRPDLKPPTADPVPAEADPILAATDADRAGPEDAALDATQPLSAAPARAEPIAAPVARNGPGASDVVPVPRLSAPSRLAPTSAGRPSQVPLEPSNLLAIEPEGPGERPDRSDLPIPAGSVRPLPAHAPRIESLADESAGLKAAAVAVRDAPPDGLSMDRRPGATGSADVPGGDGKYVPPALYQDRFAPDRERIVDAHGGSPATEGAVEMALVWLAANQAKDGRWDADRNDAGRERAVLGQDRARAGLDADTGITGLALLAFLGAGHTHQQGQHQETMRRGLDFLLKIQSADGNMGGRAALYARMYCHAMAMFALSEAYAITRDPQLEAAVRRAVEYSLAAQNPVTGGWRYRPGDAGDTSQLGWQIMALKSAQMAGVEIPPAVQRGVARFLASVASGTNNGLAGYRPFTAPTRTMTAEALVCRVLADMPHDPRADDEAARYLLEDLPDADGPNLYYWYYATLGLYCLQGQAWPTWNEALKAVLLPAQRTDGRAAGSWDPDTVWGGYGGRVYSTSMAALMLEVYYRYLPLYVEAARRSGRSPVVR